MQQFEGGRVKNLKYKEEKEVNRLTKDYRPVRGNYLVALNIWDATMGIIQQLHGLTTTWKTQQGIQKQLYTMKHNAVNPVNGRYHLENNRSP